MRSNLIPDPTPGPGPGPNPNPNPNPNPSSNPKPNPNPNPYQLVHVEILAPVAKWWWVVLVLYHVWFLFLVLIQVLRFVRGHAYYGSTHMTMARLLR